jgi:hypothetical protein
MDGKFPSHIHPNFPPKSGISDPFPISRSLCGTVVYIENILYVATINFNEEKQNKKHKNRRMISYIYLLK